MTTSLSQQAKRRPVQYQDHRGAGTTPPAHLGLAGDVTRGPCCDVGNCGRRAEIERGRRHLCSWHWAEFRYENSGVWVNPALTRRVGRTPRPSEAAA